MKAKKIKRESWRTTDAEERAKRQERAKVEPMKVRTVDAPDGFGLYEVSHPAAGRHARSPGVCKEVLREVQGYGALISPSEQSHRGGFCYNTNPL